MKSKLKDNLLKITLISIIFLVLVYLFARPIIVLLNLCGYFESYCRFFLSVLYNYIIYWLLLCGFAYATAKISIGFIRRRRYLNEFLLYKGSNAKLDKILAYCKEEFKIFFTPTRKQVAFSTGLRKKAIYLSLGTIEQLSDHELEALVYHELSHLLNNDIYILSLMMYICDLFFYLPVIKFFFNNLESKKEYFADNFAATKLGNKESVINALLRVSKLKLEENYLPAAFSNGKTDVINRIKRLQGKEIRRHLSKPAIAITLTVMMTFSILTVNAKAATDSGRFCRAHNISCLH